MRTRHYPTTPFHSYQRANPNRPFIKYWAPQKTILEPIVAYRIGDGRKWGSRIYSTARGATNKVADDISRRLVQRYHDNADITWQEQDDIRKQIAKKARRRVKPVIEPYFKQ